LTSALSNIGITELFNDLGRKVLDPSYTGEKNNASVKKKVKEVKDEEEREKGIKLEAGNKKNKKKTKFC